MDASENHRRNALVTFGLIAAMSVPVIYFGAQVVSAPSYEGYRWVQQLASELGTEGKRSAVIFNAGMLLVGVLTLIAAPAFWLALKPEGASGTETVAVALTLVSSGGATVWAALHPLPSGSHNPGLWGIGTVLFPAALAWAMRRMSDSAAVRIFLWVSFSLAVMTLVGIEAGLANGWSGLVQRGAAILVYVPVAVGAARLTTRSA